MKGIKCCAGCAGYSLKKHKCTYGAKDPGKATDRFYADCPLDDAEPEQKRSNKIDLIFSEQLKLTLKINDYIAEKGIIVDTSGLDVITTLSSLGLLDVDACRKYLE